VLSAVLAAWLAAASPSIPDRSIVLNDHSLVLHFANAGAADGRPLLVYATGDGGWRRKDLAAYKHLVSFGFPIVGFDARDYVTHLGAGDTITPQALAGDYARIVVEARSALHLAVDHPIIFVGISRGAGLSVAAAGAGALRPSLAGVVAIALTREEEYVKESALYDTLPRLAVTPIAVVQSTRDKYLSASDARVLFGPDTPYRWLIPVQARNHSFGGARRQLYDSVQRALAWTLGVRSVNRPCPGVRSVKRP